MSRVLIVDDNADVLESTTILLEMLGFDVAGVAGAAEILAAAKAFKPDIILQDVQMPGLVLATLVQRLRAEPVTRGAVILLFTADASADELAVAVGADGVVAKPFEGDRIKGMLDLALGQAVHR